MRSHRVLGIDPSTTSTGLVVLAASVSGKPEILHRAVVKPATKMKAGPKKQSEICSAMIDVLNDHHPDTVVIEGYGFSFKHPGSIGPLAELGGIIRYFLHQYGYGFFDPSPTCLKVFLMEDGKAKKKEMVARAEKEWGFKAKDDNECDAFTAALMGLAVVGHLGKLSMSKMEQVGQMRFHPCN